MNPRDYHVTVCHDKVVADFSLFQRGDRVKLKFNGKTGTVTENQTLPYNLVSVQWDESGKTIWENPSGLVVLHAPRPSNTPHPNQELIDQIEAVRLPLKAEIEQKQALLSHLTRAKKIAEQV